MTVRTICAHAITLSITLNLLPLLRLEIKAQPKIEKPAPNCNTVQLGGFRSVKQPLSSRFLTITGRLTALTEPYCA